LNAIQTWNNITICGGQGTGKTTLEGELLRQYPRVVIFDPNDEFQDYPSRYVPESDSPLELERVASKVWASGNAILVVSEAELYLPVTKPLTRSVFKILSRGRHRNCGIMADTRRIALLNKSVFSLSKHVFIFRHFAPNDIRYLQEFIPENCKELASMKDHFYWHYSEGKLEKCPPLKLGD